MSPSRYLPGFIAAGLTALAAAIATGYAQAPTQTPAPPAPALAPLPIPAILKQYQPVPAERLSAQRRLARVLPLVPVEIDS